MGIGKRTFVKCCVWILSRWIFFQDACGGADYGARCAPHLILIPPPSDIHCIADDRAVRPPRFWGICPPAAGNGCHGRRHCIG